MNKWAYSALRIFGSLGWIYCGIMLGLAYWQGSTPSVEAAGGGVVALLYLAYATAKEQR